MAKRLMLILGCVSVSRRGNASSICPVFYWRRAGKPGKQTVEKKQSATKRTSYRSMAAGNTSVPSLVARGGRHSFFTRPGVFPASLRDAFRFLRLCSGGVARQKAPRSTPGYFPGIPPGCLKAIPEGCEEKSAAPLRLPRIFPNNGPTA